MIHCAFQGQVISCLIYSSQVYQACAKFIMKALFNTQLLKENWDGTYYGPHLFRPFQCCLFVNIGDVGGVLKIRNLGSAMVVTCQASISQVCASLSQELLLHRLSSHCIVSLYIVLYCIMCAWLFQQAPMPRLSPHIPAGNLYPGYHPILAGAC